MAMNRKQIVEKMLTLCEFTDGMTIEGLEISPENADALSLSKKKLLIEGLEKITIRMFIDDRHLEEPVEETVLDASSAEYFHMHFKSNAKLDFESAVTFRNIGDEKWVCHKSSKKNLAWMTEPKVIYASGKYEPGVQREVISVYERDIKVLKHWLTSGRHGKTVSMYFSNNELPYYDACEVGKPMYQSEALVDVKPGEEIPF